MTNIFVNLPVADVEASKTFFGELGFDFNPDFADDKAACMVVDENIFVMMLAAERFQEFINGKIADAPKMTEAITCISVDSRERVDELVEKAIEAGGKEWQPAHDHGSMYGASFQDLDGHAWELMYMERSD